jgi:hypothetical protein
MEFENMVKILHSDLDCSHLCSKVLSFTACLAALSSTNEPQN